MIVVLGATGQLGQAFRSVMTEGVFLGPDDVDLAEPESMLRTIDRSRPTAIVNCAAYTQVDRAEEEEPLARRINGEAVGELARYAAERDVPFVTYSTDYVFAGDGERPCLESDPTAPLNAYGRTKLRGERLALAHDRRTLVIRTSWLISTTPPNFVTTMLDRARTRTLQVVNDQHGSPTVARDLARGTLAALDARVTGVLHLTNTGVTTWFDLARAALELAGLDPEHIQPCATKDFPRPARRPAYSVLGSERLSHLGLRPLPPWRDSLADLVSALLETG